MPFGLKKGEKDGDLDSKKASLFSRSSKASKSPAPATNNPYAIPPTNDPYARKPANPYDNQNATHDPYARSQSSFSQPPTSSFGNLTLNSEQGHPPAYGRSSPLPNRDNKSPVPPGGYGGAAPRYQSQGSYGQAGGYGSDPYGAGQSQPRPGGYGGLGRSNSQDTMTTDAGRNALFGDAPQRVQQQQAVAAEQPTDGSYSNTGGYAAADMPGGYGSNADRELTAEELEEQEVDTAKQEIRFIKQQDVAATRNARRIAEQAEMTGRDTLARLGAQGDRIHNTEHNLDSAAFQNQRAEEKAKELKTLNRSMFAVHVSNPFTSESRLNKALDSELAKRQHERQTQQMTRENAYQSEQRHQKQIRDTSGNAIRQSNQRSLANRGKYQFEADSEDDEMENEIEDNLDAIHRGARVLNQLGKAMGEEIDSQNKHIDRIITKTDKVDDQIAINRARLDRIK